MNLEINKIEQINFEMAGSCNLKCPMCPQSKGREEDFLKKLPLSLFQKVVDEGIEYGLKYVNLSGSGEPLISKDLEEAISYAHSKDLITMIYTNGALLSGKRFEKLCQAGLSICKVSCMGWDRESYHKWMSADNFEKVRKNLKTCLSILKTNKYKTYLQVNHLVHDYKNLEFEKSMYIKNWIEYLGIKGEIWMEHNWAGLYSDTKVPRQEIFANRHVRSCGRPLANVVEIRAGGEGEHYGAVVPCPNVLGQDSKAIMGHIDEMSLMDVLNGEKMKELRRVHITNEFEKIDYCYNCDQILDVEESLVWTNVKGRKYEESRISNMNYVNSINNWKK